jgi:hypothetical protein
MKKNLVKILMLLLICSLASPAANAQGRLIRKIQERAEDKAVDKIFGESDKKESPDSRPYESESSQTTRNRKGAGLTKDTPDVIQNINDADRAFEASKFSESKSAIRNALWGVELGIGQNVLKSMPEKVDGMDALTDEDRVSSTGFGFVGFVIERSYRDGKEKQLQAAIGSDAALLGMAGMYMAGGMYQTTDETNQKQIRFQEHRASIHYDDYEGYTLSVPFGQSSIFLVKGKNFEDESQFMSAAGSFDMNTIKRELGEQ